MKKWKTKLDNIDLSDLKPKDLAHNFYSNIDGYNWCSLNSFGFEKSTIEIPNYKLDENLVEKYENESKPNDMKHITSCDMSDAYAKVHKDNRTHHNNMYLVPPHRYKK